MRIALTSCVAVVCSLGCATEPEVKDPPVTDVADGGHEERPADGTVKTEPIPDDGEERPKPVTGIGMGAPREPGQGPKVDPIQVTIFNRLLVKPKSPDMPESEIKRVAEEATGQKVERLRKTAVKYYLVVFEPASPARTAEEQKALIAALQQSGAFEVVEGDQLMTIK